MITVRDGDRAKVAGLVAGIVLVGGFIYMRAQSMAPPQSPSTEVALTSDARGQVFVDEGATTTAVVMDPNSIETANPFRKVLADPDGTYVPAPQPRPQATITRESIPVRQVSSEFPTMPGVGAGKSPDLAGASGVRPATFDVQSVLQLEGVLTGARPVAVVKSGQTTHVVSVGEKIAGLTVIRIAETEVTLKHGSEIVKLRLDN